MGDHPSRVHRRTTHAAHRTTHVSHRVTKERSRSAHARHKSHEHAKAVPAMSKKAIRRCHGMSYRELLRHRDCAALLQREVDASSHAKHRSKSHKAASKRHKRERRNERRHRTSARHHSRSSPA
jgi:hypothetical protein